MDKFLFMERQTRRGGGHKKEFPPQSFQFLYQEWKGGPKQQGFFFLAGPVYILGFCAEYKRRERKKKAYYWHRKVAFHRLARANRQQAPYGAHLGPSSINHFLVQRQGLAGRHAGKRKETVDLVVEDGGGQWTDEEYEPVVLKLEVHFGAKRKQNKKKAGRVWMNQTSSFPSSSGSSGFIHLFLPISLPARQQQLSPTTTPAATSVVSGAETVTHRPKRVNQKKKKKKKKKRKKKQPQQMIVESNTMDGISDDVEQRYKPMQASPSNRLMPLLLHDDGIPPMLNSLSSDETQQWARWLRCTLCLKVCDSLLCTRPAIIIPSLSLLNRTTESSRMRNLPCASCRMSSAVRPTLPPKMNWLHPVVKVTPWINHRAFISPSWKHWFQTPCRKKKNSIASSSLFRIRHL